MPAYLLTWSPKQYDFHDLPAYSEEVKKGKPVNLRWSCGRRQIIQKGDRVFLIRLGEEPKGVFGAGTVTQGAHQALHWQADKQKAGEKAWYVYSDYDVLLDPERDRLLPRSVLDKPPFAGVHWSTQASGIDIPDRIAAELDKALAQLRGTQTGNPLHDLDQCKNTYISLPGTEREAVVRSRMGQGRFRAALIHYWNGCAVTGCKVIHILRASHIKPWRVSSNDERLDLYNGLLLIPNVDGAFDGGLISFADDGKIMISRRLSRTEANILGILPSMGLSRIEESHRKYLDHHRKKVFR